MEKSRDITQNIMPEMHLFPRLERVGHFIAGLFKQLHYPTPSEHFVPFEKELYEVRTDIE